MIIDYTKFRKWLWFCLVQASKQTDEFMLIVCCQLIVKKKFVYKKKNGVSFIYYTQTHQLYLTGNQYKNYEWIQ